MPNNVTETVIGGVVLATAIGFAVYAGQNAGIGGSDESYSLSASFRSVEGISVGTDVRVAGIKVGSVTDLELDPGSFRAKANFTIRHDLEIPEDSDIKIASEGLLGGSFVEITPGASDYNLEPGSEFLNTQGSVDFLNLLMRFGSK